MLNAVLTSATCENACGKLPTCRPSPEWYSSASTADGLPPGEGAFLACSFWLVDNLALLGRRDDARRLFERLLALRNDVGLLAEEYEPRLRRQVGNFPQAFSHVALVDTALNISHRDTAAPRPAAQRATAGVQT